MNILILLAGIFIGVCGTLGCFCLLAPRPDDFPDLEHVPPHLRNAFIGNRRTR